MWQILTQMILVAHADLQGLLYNFGADKNQVCK